jgi:tRNA pseudouridine38-40 synthase
VHVDLEHPLVTAHGQSHPCLDVLQKSLPKALPPDIVVRGIMEAPEGFDARFSAVSRRYIYRLWDHAQYDPLTLTYTTYYRHTLDTELMNQAAQQLVGLHDFIGFCKAKPEGTTMRHLRHLSVARQQDSSIAITAEADAFCHSMVRSLVGALVNVGRQRRTVAWLADCLQAAGRLGDIVVMPPQGLTLEEVTYPPDHELATRAGEARRRRDDLS